MKRGATKRSDCTFVGVWVPKIMEEQIDDAVSKLDLDRSKFLRRAIEEKLAKQSNQ